MFRLYGNTRLLFLASCLFNKIRIIKKYYIARFVILMKYETDPSTLQ